MVCLYVAIGFASDRQQVLEVALINYLWPALTLVFAIPILRKKAQVWLVFGVFLGFVGVFFATFSGESFSWRTFGENMAANYLPYVFAFVAAVSWALYSNLSRLWGGQTESGGVPLFLLLSGLVFVSLRAFTPEDTRWTFRSMLELVYMMIFPTALGYVFWDEAMRKGRIILVASLSYLTPLLSAVIAIVYLGVRAGWNLWIGCILVVAGAAVCKLSVKEDLEGVEPSTEKY
jgi:drug/metabolite transporter (DMT)-like permease